MKKAIAPFVFLLCILTLGFLKEKGFWVLWMNQLHNPITDVIFVTLSTIGNAWSALVFFGLVMVFFDQKHIYLFLIAFGIETILVTLGKRVFFPEFNRPRLFFTEQGIFETLQLVKGIPVRAKHSFPSGHTSYIFMIASYFALKFKNYQWSIPLAILAFLIGCSRMYLVQHFFRDVYVGIFVGTISSVIAYSCFFTKEKFWHGKRVFFK